MPRKRLTEQTVFSLPPKRSPYRARDTGTDAVRGLHVLVQPSGTRTFRVLYQFKGSTRHHNMMLGRVGDISLELARDKAQAVRRAVAKGEDPKADDPVATDTFKHSIATWTANEQKGRKLNVSADECARLVLSACARWHERPIGTLRSAEIDDLLCEMRDGSRRRRKAPYLSNRVHAHLKTFFRWCVRTKRLPANPIVSVPRPWEGATRRQRAWFEGERADEVIKALWREADALGGDRGRFIKLLVVTGKRRTAVQTMRWEQIDNDWYWRPPAGAKPGKKNNKRCHAIPLPKLAQRVLSPREDKGRVLVSFDADNLAQDMRAAIGVPDFIWHGVRHVVESKLAELRVQPHIRDLLLDHAPQRGTGKEYDHWEYRDERTEALELWCLHIEALLTPAGVAMLR